MRYGRGKEKRKRERERRKEKKEKEKEESRRASSSNLWHSDGRDSLDQEIKSVYSTRATREY